MLHGFPRWRNPILSACLGVSENRFRLRRRIVASCFALFRQKRLRSTHHPLSVRFVSHIAPVPDY
jgi:hypothetical protein